MSDGPTPEMVAKALRDKKNPVKKELHPVEMRARGYQLYKREAQTMGEPVKSYEEWMKTQEPM